MLEERMGIKLLAIAAIGAFPAVALAQQGSTASTKEPATSAGTQATRTTVTTSTGAVVSTTVVTPAMLKAQQDPNLIGSPAWWSTRATADGKPKRS
jgi:hypothetical protein